MSITCVVKSLHHANPYFIPISAILTCFGQTNTHLIYIRQYIFLVQIEVIRIITVHVFPMYWNFVKIKLKIHLLLKSSFKIFRTESTLNTKYLPLLCGLCGNTSQYIPVWRKIKYELFLMLMFSLSLFITFCLLSTPIFPPH